MSFFGSGFEATQATIPPPPKGDKLSIHAKISQFMIAERWYPWYKRLNGHIGEMSGVEVRSF